LLAKLLTMPAMVAAPSLRSIVRGFGGGDAGRLLDRIGVVTVHRIGRVIGAGDRNLRVIAGFGVDHLGQLVVGRRLDGPIGGLQ